MKLPSESVLQIICRSVSGYGASVELARKRTREWFQDDTLQRSWLASRKIPESEGVALRIDEERVADPFFAAATSQWSARELAEALIETVVGEKSLPPA